MSKPVEIDRLYRANFVKLVASLVSYFGLASIALAEDLVQETFLAAIDNWENQMPSDPEAWLFKVCKNKAINYLNKQSTKATHQSWFEKDVITEAYKIDQLFLSHEIEDNQLRLLFAFCHPDLSNKAQVILTIRIIAGFKPEEIARGLGLSTDAVKKMLVRTKKKIKDSGIQLKVPFIFKSQSRLNNVHKVIYLIFNEGYNATRGDRLIRHELCQEGVRLIQSLIKMQKIHNTDSYALLALMLFNVARFPARQAKNGAVIDLETQDRSLWHQDFIKAGFMYLKKAKQGNRLSNYYLEAGIAAIHCSAPTFEKTDWCLILRLYKQLYQINASPFIRLNKAIAISYCHSPTEAIDTLQESDTDKSLQDYYLYHVTLGKLYVEMDELYKAKKHLEKGLQLTYIKAERDYIKRLLSQLVK